jgi:hypothetical protein
MSHTTRVTIFRISSTPHEEETPTKIVGPRTRKLATLLLHTSRQKLLWIYSYVRTHSSGIAVLIQFVSHNHCLPQYVRNYCHRDRRGNIINYIATAKFGVIHFKLCCNCINRNNYKIKDKLRMPLRYIMRGKTLRKLVKGKTSNRLLILGVRVATSGSQLQLFFFAACLSTTWRILWRWMIK